MGVVRVSPTRKRHIRLLPKLLGAVGWVDGLIEERTWSRGINRVRQPPARHCEAGLPLLLQLPPRAATLRKRLRSERPTRRQQKECCRVAELQVF